MDDIVDRALSVAKQPGTDVWRRLSDKVLQDRGAATYYAPLIPGFEDTMASNILMVPSEETYQEQVARGETPHYVQHDPFREAKKDGLTARRTIRAVSKIAMAVSWEASRRPYAASNTNPTDGVYNPEEEFDNAAGVESAWRGLNDRGQASDTAEPPVSNSTLSGVGGVK
jgi:hypothetical protein